MHLTTWHQALREANVRHLPLPLQLPAFWLDLSPDSEPPLQTHQAQRRPNLPNATEVTELGLRVTRWQMEGVGASTPEFKSQFSY